MVEGQTGIQAANRGRLFILLSAILWSLAGVFIKSLDLEPLSIVFYRSLFAALFFLLWVRKEGWVIGVPLLVVGELPSLATFVGGGMILLGLAVRYRSALFRPREWGAEENR